MLRIFHGRAPERHDRIADVLVQRATVLFPDDTAHRGQVCVDVLAQLLGPQCFRNTRKATHVREQDGQFGVLRLHAVLARVGHNAVHYLRRHVLAEPLGNLAPRAGFDEIAVSHVHGVNGRRHQDRGGQRQHGIGFGPDQHVEARDERHAGGGGNSGPERG